MAQIKEYKGYIINFDEFNEQFIARNKKGEDIASNLSIKKLQEILDKIQKKDFKRISVWHNLKKYEITSFNSEDGSVWISNEKDREKERSYGEVFSDLYGDTPENQEIMAKVIELKKQKERIANEIEHLMDSAKYFTVKDLQ